MMLHQAGEVLHWDETGVLWVQLWKKQDRDDSQMIVVNTAGNHQAETTPQFALERNYIVKKQQGFINRL